MGSSFSRMEQNLGKAGYIFSKSFRVQLWACRRQSAQGGCPSLGNVFLSLDPPHHHCGKPLQKWWDLHPLIYVPSVGSKQGNTISSRHPSPSGTSLMWGPFSDPHSTANPPSHDGEGEGTPFRRPSPPRAAGPSVPLPSVVSHRASS